MLTIVIREVQWQSPEANFITHWYPSHQAPKFVWKLLLKFHSYLQETKKLLSWMIHVLFAARPVFRLYGLCDPRNHQTTGCAAQVIPYPPCHSTSRQMSRQLLISSAAFLGCFSAIFKVSYTLYMEPGIAESHLQASQVNHDIFYFLNNSLVFWVCGSNFKCAIFKDTHVFYWLVSETFRVKFCAVECHRISVMLTEHWFR